MGKFCSSCGREVGENYNVCPNCGFNLNPSSSEVLYNNTPTYGEPTKKLNMMALLGFIFTLTTGPILGLVFSIVGLVQASKRNETGKGFAIAGIVISSLYILAIVFFIVDEVNTFNRDNNYDYRYDYPTTNYDKYDIDEFFTQSERLINEVQTVFMSDFVLKENYPEGYTCVKYKVDESNVLMSPDYEGWVWADYSDRDEIEYGISMMDDTYKIDEEISYRERLSIDDVEKKGYYFYPNAPFNCYDYTDEYVNKYNTIENTSM